MAVAQEVQCHEGTETDDHHPGTENGKILRIQEALYLILGQDHRSAVSHDHRRPGSGRLFRRGAYTATDQYDDDDDHYDVDDGAYVEYEYDPEYMAADDSWVDDSQFDANAAYYENAEYDVVEDAEYDVEAYDEAYAAYLDARRRFQDLKLSRGFYPVVALADQGAMPTSSSSQTPIGTGRGKGYGGGGKAKSRGRGKGKNIVRYPPRGDRKPPDPRGRAAAITHCLRCGATGHQAAQCPRTSKHSAPPSSTSPSPKKHHTEGMAILQPLGEHGHVIFEDVDGLVLTAQCWILAHLHFSWALVLFIDMPTTSRAWATPLRPLRCSAPPGLFILAVITQPLAIGLPRSPSL